VCPPAAAKEHLQNVSAVLLLLLPLMLLVLLGLKLLVLAAPQARWHQGLFSGTV